MGVSTGAINQRYAATFVDELARSGLHHVCISPGSRSTPLALAFAENEHIKVWMHVDERSAAFFALGLAKVSRVPVALLCTSGTAAANFYPAVIEAHYARVPLLVLTADRPPELRENGAPQAIDQLHLYGQHSKWFMEAPLPDGSTEILRHIRVLASRALTTAAASPQGAVHLNFPFREPLLPLPGEEIAPDEGRADRAPWVRVRQGDRNPDAVLIERLASQLHNMQRGLVICGPQDAPSLADSLTLLAGRLGYPVLADGLSLVRSGPHDRSLVLDTYDAFLRDARWADAHSPEVVLRFGAAPTSKPLVQFLQRHSETHQIIVDEDGSWRDPSLLATEMVYADPVLFCEELGARLPKQAQPPGPWAAEWVEANDRARAAIEVKLGETESLSEGGLFAEFSRLLPDGATLFVGNSMPVRDLDTFFASSEKRVLTLCNRGANGIDGVVSSALGAGAASKGPLVLAIGDLSFYHDMNGLLAAKLHDLNATILLINNDGGGIFSFLPQREHPEHFERLFGTPTGLDFRAATQMYGGEHVLAEDWTTLREGLHRGIQARGLTVVEVRTDREENVRLHREVWAAVADALQTQPTAGALL